MNNRNTRASEKWRDRIKEWQGIDLSGNKVQPESHCETCYKIIADLESLEAENADLHAKLEEVEIDRVEWKRRATDGTRYHGE